MKLAGEQPEIVCSSNLTSTSTSPERGETSRKKHLSPKSESAILKFCRKLSPSRRKRLEKGIDISNNAAPCKDLQRVFNYFDEDGDGKISPAELQSCVRTVGGELSKEEAEMAVQTSDVDGDGMLGFEDFAQLMEGGKEEEKRGELREAFGMYEMKGTGCITPKSLKRMMARLGEPTTIEDCKAMISKFDLNGDGALNFDEFISMMGGS